jgi:hypothetical protein
MSEKKMVRRSVAIALGILCIILVAGFSGVIAYYVTTLNNNNASYNDYVLSHSYTNYDYSVLNSSLNLYRSQVNDLTSILQLEKVETVYSYSGEIVLPANFSTEPDINEYMLDGDPQFGLYAGIAYVQVSSTSNETYVNVKYSAQYRSFDYNSQTDVGMNGTVVFAVLPAGVVDIRIALHDTSIRATANVTITYIY